jgi:hypothetical protein
MRARLALVIASVLVGCSEKEPQPLPRAQASYAAPRLADYRYDKFPYRPDGKLLPEWGDLTMAGAPERDRNAPPLGCDEACVRDRERVASLAGTVNEGVVASLKTFFGDRRGGYFVPDWTLARQVEAGLRGPPDRVSGVASGELMVSGCRHMSCGEKAAIIVRPTGELLAAALISYRCSGREPDRPPCSDRRVLTVFVRPDGDSHRYRRVFKRWASVVSAPVGDHELVLVPTT